MAAATARRTSAKKTVDPKRALARRLDTITSTIAMVLSVKIVPGREWKHVYNTRTCVVPYHDLLTMNPNDAGMALWQTAAHVAFTVGTLSEYDVLVDTVLEIEDRKGLRTTHPNWLMPLIAYAEQERVATRARTLGRSIATRQLPRRGTSFRKNDRTEDLAAIAAPVPTEVSYWDVASSALRGVVSGTLTLEDLHNAKIMWPEERLTAIATTTQAQSYDDLMVMMQPIIVDIACDRATSLAEPEAEPEEETQDLIYIGGAGENADPSETIKHDPSSDEDKGQAPDPNPSDESREDTNTEPDPNNEEPPTENEHELVYSPAVRHRIQSEIEAESPERTTIDFTVDAGKLIISINNEKLAEIDLSQLLQPLDSHEVLWENVSRSNASITAPLRRIIADFLTENEIGELERGTRTGRIDMRQIARPALASSTPPFRRRLEPEDRSYDVVIVVDRSGSMGAVTGTTEDPSVFGTMHGARWHLATRMLVGLCEALQHLPGTRTGVITYCSTIDTPKQLHEPLSDEIKDTIIATTGPNASNDDAGALRAAIGLFRESQAERRLLIFLTDGQFCSDERSMNDILQKTRSANIKFVVLTVGTGPENAQRYVGKNSADEITEHTIATVLSRHLTRMIGDG